MRCVVFAPSCELEGVKIRVVRPPYSSPRLEHAAERQCVAWRPKVSSANASTSGFVRMALAVALRGRKRRCNNEDEQDNGRPESH